ncbi:MAG: hypothetical protein EXR73_04925 [Myxococcales bacterium]|nr:hypothetical protein [Myxococcales bacterium]
MSRRQTSKQRLPEALRRYFWDTDFDRVTWADNFGYIVNRLLSVGGPDVVALASKLASSTCRTLFSNRRSSGDAACSHRWPIWRPRYRADR